VPGEVNVVAVSRAGVPRLDVDELLGQEGDVVHLAVLRESLASSTPP